MAAYRVQDRAGRRLDEIYVYTRDTWGEEQAARYIRGLFATFDAIASRTIPWRAIPAEFGVDGFCTRYEHRYSYWMLLSNDVAGVVAVLHERMHQLGRFRDVEPESGRPFLEPQSGEKCLRRLGPTAPAPILLVHNKSDCADLGARPGITMPNRMDQLTIATCRVKSFAVSIRRMRSPASLYDCGSGAPRNPPHQIQR